MTWGHGLTSPDHHYPLTELDGDPDQIQVVGEFYRSVGARMRSTAGELQLLAGNRKYRALGLDAIRESAGELEADLHNIATRYERTGPVLVDYAVALRRARNTTVDPYVPRIRAAHEAHEEAVAARREAQRRADDVDTTWVWEQEPTEAERRAAARDLSNAQTAESGAEQSLNGLWESFEAGYGSWEAAYEDAVTGVEAALEASGIDDTWWEDALDTVAFAATVIGAIAIVVALVVTGPFAAIALVVATVVSVLALAAHLTMAFAGSRRVTGGDLVLDIVGVVPFLGAFAKAFKGAGALGALRIASGASTATGSTLSAGRNAVALDLRAVTGAGRGGNRAAREAAAPGLANDFVQGVRSSWGQGTWNAIRGGGSRTDGLAWTMSERMATAWPGAGRAGMRSQNWMQLNGQMPGPFVQGLNVWNAGNGVYSGIAEFIPGAPQTADAIPDLLQR